MLHPYKMRVKYLRDGLSAVRIVILKWRNLGYTVSMAIDR
jgi:hypothetical protein